MSPNLNRTVVTKHLHILSAILVGLIILAGIAVAVERHRQQSSPRKINGKPLAEKEPRSHRTSFTENGPEGRWSASFIPDRMQSAATSPVVIIGNSTLMGNAKLRNLQLTHLTLKNYSAQAVLGIQLKWFVTTRLDPTKVLPPPGYTGLFETPLPPRASEKFESPLIKFSQTVRHLLKEGKLDGEFLVQLQDYQVEFDDGSS